jgi:hypothetical protein
MSDFDSYLDYALDRQYPPAPKEPVIDTSKDFGSITPIKQTKFESMLEKTGLTLEQVGNELDKLGKVSIGGIELGIRDFLPFVGSMEDGKVTGTPATLQALGRGESIKGKSEPASVIGPDGRTYYGISGQPPMLNTDAAMTALDVATAGVIKPAVKAGKTAVKKVINAGKNLPVGMSIKAIDGTETVLEKAPKISTPAFKNWFGNSKATDEAGKPIVVYHSTRGQFDEFNTTGEGQSVNTGTFFSSSPDVAATYNTSSEHSMVPAYLSLKNPMIVDANGANWNRIGQDAKVSLPEIKVSAKDDEMLLSELTGEAPNLNATRSMPAKDATAGEIFGEQVFEKGFSTNEMARWARSKGYDGVIFKNVVDHGPAVRFSTEASEKPSNIYVAFEPTQIKSAISNVGTFDPKNPSMLKGAGAATAGATATQEESK